MSIEVETRNTAGRLAAIGASDSFTRGINLDRVAVRVSGNFIGEPAVSTEILYEVEIAGDASDERIRELVEYVDRVADIPNSLRGGTPVVCGEFSWVETSASGRTRHSAASLVGTYYGPGTPRSIPGERQLFETAPTPARYRQSSSHLGLGRRIGEDLLHRPGHVRT